MNKHTKKLIKFGKNKKKIFKFMEKDKMNKEIQLRNKIGADSRIPPKPRTSFVETPFHLFKKIPCLYYYNIVLVE